MIIQNNISEFLILESEPVIRGLEKISNNQHRILFVIDDSGRLVGSFSDGDFRRWLTFAQKFDNDLEIRELMNGDVVSGDIDSNRAKIEELFNSKIDIVPLIDGLRRVVALAFSRGKGLTIGRHLISEDSPTFLIAEIGNNHQGDVDQAKKLVDLAIESGADCVKFQLRNMTALYKNGGEQDESADLGAQYTLDILNKYQLTAKEMQEVFEYCKKANVSFMCTPWDLESVKVLNGFGLDAYKVASADLTNHELLKAIIATGKPMICSTGMSTEVEIEKTANYLSRNGAEFIFLHCNSTYPTPFKDVNLAYIDRLKRLAGCMVGYSGHERGISVPIAAVALGARVVEKHFTIDKSLEGSDHKVSLLPEEFKEMVKRIREVELSLGRSEERVVTQGEMINREVLAKSLVAGCDIEKDETITRDKVDIKSPGLGLQPIYMDQLLGLKAKRKIERGDYFYESDVLQSVIEARDYKFSRSFGIPVRFHDFNKLVAQSNFDFVEFHLSYTDMRANIEDYISSTQKISFVVHCPELFEADHIVDLSDSGDYGAVSIQNIQRVCDLTRKLKLYFPETQTPMIIVNAGGFTQDSFMCDETKKKFMYHCVANNLSRVNQDGVEIILQTMPPFPWHFGGQRYHNLFVCPDEIIEFCNEYGYRICFDTSHSMMASTHYNWNFYEFTKKVAPFIAHMHISDAAGVDGEGVKSGEGQIDFIEMIHTLDAYAPHAPFITEVWQGHKNNGAGFWQALNFLEAQGL